MVATLEKAVELPEITYLNDKRYWDDLRVFAETLDDAMSFRIATENRIRSAAMHEGDLRVKSFVDSVKEMENNSRLAAIRYFRKSGFRDWQERHHGVGDKLLARLLGHLGDPLLATPRHWVEGTGDKKRILIDGEPFYRTVGQLWQYCGHGAPSRRMKGMSQEELFAQGNPTIKMIVHLIAEGCIKEPGRSMENLGDDGAKWHYRRVYEARRIATLEKAHTINCVRCGPSGKPALEGSPWSAAHQHNDALRIVGKEILRDLWLESRRLRRIEN